MNADWEQQLTESTACSPLPQFCAGAFLHRSVREFTNETWTR